MQISARRRFALRTLLWATVAAALVVGLVSHLHPNMLLDWAALAQLCGLR